MTLKVRPSAVPTNVTIVVTIHRQSAEEAIRLVHVNNA